MSAHRPASRSAVVAGIVVAGLWLTACSSGTTTTPSASATGPQTYSDPTFGYSITYAPPFRQGSGQDVQQAGRANNPAASNIMFYDSAVVVSRTSPPAGLPKAVASKVAEQMKPGQAFYPVSLTVSTFSLAEAVTEANLAEAKVELEHNVLPQLEQPGVTAGPLTETTVAGRPAFRSVINGRSASTGEPFREEVTFAFADSNEYQISATAPTAQWKQAEPAFQKMMGSITLPGTWQSSTPSTSGSGNASP